MLNKYLISIVGLVALAIFVYYSPGIDQYLARQAYNVTTERFYGEVHLWCKIVYYSIPALTTLLIVIPLIQIFRSKHTSNPKATRRAAVIVLLSMAIGPGLVVNKIFKENWGRPRPYQVLRDGKTFSPVWHDKWGDSKSNSFPCGHASIGFFLGVPLLAYGRRKQGYLVGLTAGAFVGLVRMLQGGHYLSDVVFCGIFVWLSAEIVTYFLNRVMKV